MARQVVIVEDEMAPEMCLDVEDFLRRQPNWSDVLVIAFTDVQSALGHCLAHADHIKVLVLDCAFAGDNLAGCTLYKDLIRQRPILRRRTRFVTAFEAVVEKELVPGLLSKNQIITKRPGGIEQLEDEIKLLL